MLCAGVLTFVSFPNPNERYFYYFKHTEKRVNVLYKINYLGVYNDNNVILKA